MKPRIIVIGLGPGGAGFLTRDVWNELTSTKTIYLRTNEHPAVKGLPRGLEIESFDHLYESAQDFEEVYDGIIASLIQKAKSVGEVLYAVPGDPYVGETTVLGLKTRAKEEDIHVIVKPGVSFIEPCLHLLGLDALDGLQIIDALDLTKAHHPQLSPDQPALIAQLYSRHVAADVKLTLFNQYPQEHPVKILHAVGTVEAQVEALPLFKIDQSERISTLTTLFLPPLERASSFESFQETVANLRSPDGCPWDREQTHKSLRMHLLEECYEVLQAIDQDNSDALMEELGDLILQIVLQTQIATEEGDFSMADVLASINEKIIRRHPHVFKDLELGGVSEVLHNWEVLKAEEREEQGDDKGILEGVPIGLPALTQANELQGRAARVGFDWRALSGVIDKIEEELSEVFEANTDQELEAELGDLFFALVNFARWKNIDPETALRQANTRFRDRFHLVEEKARKRDKKLTEMTLEEMDALWEEAKDQLE